ncbi:hypothetical protein [Nitrobacter sp.]|uniref:hypothetical protein n=1 Tax=Nitrobacter sp. TaxID=29420 RepID=UPI00399D7529
MDPLTAMVAIAHLRLRLTILERHPEFLMATPKLQGLAKAMAMLEHNLEDGAGKLLSKIESVETRGVAAIAKGHKKIDDKAALVDEIESYVTALEGANGGDPLEDSAVTSDAGAQPVHTNRWP